MRLTRLEIDNFKAVRSLLLEDLEDVVVLAGPNGCGKSTVFDAIRLWKSAHGGYQPNEVHQWFSEFQLRVGDTSILKVLGDKTKPTKISIEVKIAETELNWLKENAENLVRMNVWRQVAPQAVQQRGWSSKTGLAEDLRVHEPRVQAALTNDLPLFLTELQKAGHRGTLIIQPDANVTIDTDIILTTLFSTYEPQALGVIDYHGPQRTYQREQLGGINLNLDNKEEQNKAHALYNYNAKYSNVKSELAAAYIQDLIAQQAGAQAGEKQASLLETLHELFQVFFPGKTFKGVQPMQNGSLAFTVETAAGEHDIDDLSSGEKEVLYGYLRLRNSAPKNSVILLDEPELHLNPRLVSGLPDFYYKHLGQALNNQLWLVTHSDALLRQAVGHVGFNVFHMQPPSINEETGNQVQLIKAEEEVEQLIIDLVGDLAAYRPGGKLVILEGGGDSEVDLRIIQDLFPETLAKANFISGGSKARVREFHELLDRAKGVGAVPAKIVSIVDADFEVGSDSETNSEVLQWDRFHIENYLLEPDFILQVMADLRTANPTQTDAEAVLELLRKSAQDTLPKLLRHRLETMANKAMVSVISTKTNPNGPDPSAELRARVASSLDKVAKVADGNLSLDALRAEEEKIRAELQESLDDGTWIRKFRGRDILSRFVADHMDGAVGYVAFRDLILARMRDSGFRPDGMAAVLEKIMK